MQAAFQWLYDNLFNYMIPLCMLCLLRIAMCLVELRHMARLRERRGIFRSGVSQYAEIGCFAGLFLGFVCVCLVHNTPAAVAVCAVASVFFGVVGYRFGKKKGRAVDDFWRQVVSELDESQISRVEIANDVGGLLDTLDVYDNDPPADGADGTKQEER